MGKPRYYTVHELFCAVSRFHATFRVIYRNFDYLRDSVGLGGQTLYTIVSHNSEWKYVLF